MVAEEIEQLHRFPNRDFTVRLAHFLPKTDESPIFDEPLAREIPFWKNGPFVSSFNSNPVAQPPMLGCQTVLIVSDHKAIQRAVAQSKFSNLRRAILM
jgi:hypothetical protein